MHGNCKSMLLAKTLKIMIFLKEIAYFQEIERQKKKRRTKIDDKSHAFWDFDSEWILGGFREGFGNQNPKFSHFFRGFGDVIFRARFEKRKKRPRCPNKTQKAQICSWAPVIPRPVGKGKDRGKNTSGRIARKNVEIGQL